MRELTPDGSPSICAGRSISDDDLCASCQHLDYRPGYLSACLLSGCGRDDWPSELDENGYSVACSCYEHEKIA
ncbi:antirestriction protein [Salmonella enterica subsp. enterica]|nr:antirestriction protein [Salmonella enterica subsp. enterica]MII25857.1 antirestriction protein [Salmonella enterica subsp. enterica]